MDMTVHECLDVVIQCLCKADPDCVVFKYKDKTNTKRITTASQMPLVLSKMKEYFDGRYRPSTKAMDVWTEIKIRFNADRKTLMEDLKYLLKENGEFLLYPKAKTYVFGYLLFSVRSIERERLIETIQMYELDELNVKLEINAIWRKIIDPVIMPHGVRKPVAKGDGNAVQAYHLECEAGREDDYADMAV